MVNNQNKFLNLLLIGIFLLSICIIGTCISSTSRYNDINIVQNHVLLVPYIISYAFIVIGLLGYFNIINLIKNK